MTTPISDFIDNYIKSGNARFHMPGHKGVGDIEKYDITEIAGADVLYSAESIIEESENNASALFGTAHTFYSAEGSSLAIKAMLRLATAKGNKKILAGRNAHKAFVYAAAILDLSVNWLYPTEFTHLCACTLTGEDVEKALSNEWEKPAAVYITSPNYLGNIADIKGIAQVCKNAGVPLLVDNAHGAYLKFLSPSLHPIDLGAAMCTDSAHKTLPVLTGGAYLHVSKDYAEYCEGARNAFSVFASTSPSYIILRSLDRCNRYLDETFRYELSEAVVKTDEIKEELSRLGVPVMESEFLKITVDAAKYGYTGDALSEILRENGIECEFSDSQYLVLMISPKNSDEDFQKLKKAFLKIPQKTPLPSMNIVPRKVEARASIREAVFSDFETVSSQDAVGRICASPCVSCPPAVPIAISGEEIGAAEAQLFEKYGIQKVDVLKK